MRVVHFLTSMKPLHDGVSNVVSKLREEFRGTSSTHHFFMSMGPHPLPEDCTLVSSIPLPVSSGYRLATISLARLRRHIVRLEPSLLHIHSPCTLGFKARRIALELGIPYVATYHTHFPTYLRYYKVPCLSRLVWSLAKKLYNEASAIIVPSHQTLTELEAKGFQRLVYIPHGLDLKAFHPQFHDVNWRARVSKGKKWVVTFVSRLVWEKNLLVLVEAYKALSPEIQSQCQLVLVGDGPAKEKMMRLLPEATFTGALYGEALATSYASSDLFVFPSVTETFGSVTLEAMASGVMPIAAAKGGACELIEHGVSGFLTKPNDGKDLAKWISIALTNEELRWTCREKALQKARSFDWDKVVRETLGVYRSVLYQQSDKPPVSPVHPLRIDFRERLFPQPSLKTETQLD
jgi:phosphatidylinositol alpha 1,6-mannosyltransferase